MSAELGDGEYRSFRRELRRRAKRKTWSAASGDVASFCEAWRCAEVPSMAPPLSLTAGVTTPHRRVLKPSALRTLPLPAVDERLVMPDARIEIIDGNVEYVPPCDVSHGNRHSKISALLEAYAAPAYDVASDMLTRTSEKSDMAPDASVYPTARDPRTGGRRLEELAFKVVSTERLGHAAAKARALSARGVRRVFAVDVDRRRALAWSKSTNAWESLPSDAVIEEQVLVLPLPIHSLVDAAKADDAVAAALLAKKNSVLEAAFCKVKAGAVLDVKVSALLDVLAAREIRLSKKLEKLILAETDGAELDRLIRKAAVCTSAKGLFEP